MTAACSLSSLQTFRAAHDGDDEAVRVEKAFGLGLHLFQCHGLHEAVALFNIIDAEILLLQAEKLAGDCGIRGESQAIGAREIGLRLLEFLPKLTP